jgi:hypothetical protein
MYLLVEGQGPGCGILTGGLAPAASCIGMAVALSMHVFGLGVGVGVVSLSCAFTCDLSGER